MFLKRKLTCSFCGKNAQQVNKLVAGPRVYICDVCAAEAHRIMSAPTAGPPAANPASRAGTPLARGLARIKRIWRAGLKLEPPPARATA